MSTVFVDTSALYALLDRQDPSHSKIVESLERLAREHTLLVTTSYVLVELAILARRRLGPRVVKALARTYDSMEICWVDERLHQRAWTNAAESSKKGPSLVDWAGFLLMRDRSITTALTLDRHFKKQGFEILP